MSATDLPIDDQHSDVVFSDTDRDMGRTGPDAAEQPVVDSEGDGALPDLGVQIPEASPAAAIAAPDPVDELHPTDLGESPDGPLLAAPQPEEPTEPANQSQFSGAADSTGASEDADHPLVEHSAADPEESANEPEAVHQFKSGFSNQANEPAPAIQEDGGSTVEPDAPTDPDSDSSAPPELRTAEEADPEPYPGADTDATDAIGAGEDAAAADDHSTTGDQLAAASSAADEASQADPARAETPEGAVVLPTATPPPVAAATPIRAPQTTRPAPPRPNRFVPKRLGREAIGIAVLVVLALICAALITAVVIKTRDDAATAAREAANFTPPPLSPPSATPGQR